MPFMKQISESVIRPVLFSARISFIIFRARRGLIVSRLCFWIFWPFFRFLRLFSRLFLFSSFFKFFFAFFPRSESPTWKIFQSRFDKHWIDLFFLRKIFLTVQTCKFRTVQHSTSPFFWSDFWSPLSAGLPVCSWLSSLFWLFLLSIRSFFRSNRSLSAFLFALSCSERFNFLNKKLFSSYPLYKICPKMCPKKLKFPSVGLDLKYSFFMSKVVLPCFQ